MIEERLDNIRENNRITRSKLDRRDSNRGGRRESDRSEEARVIRQTLRALYESGNMLVFNALWNQKKHLFDGEQHETNRGN